MTEPTIREGNGHTISLREFIERIGDERWQAHTREHKLARETAQKAEDQHRTAHGEQHAMTAESVHKAEVTADRALITALASIDKRFESLTERQEMADKDTSRRLAEMERALARTTGRDSGVALSWGVVLAIAGLALALGFGLAALPR